MRLSDIPIDAPAAAPEQTNGAEGFSEAELTAMRETAPVCLVLEMIGARAWAIPCRLLTRRAGQFGRRKRGGEGLVEIIGLRDLDNGGIVGRGLAWVCADKIVMVEDDNEL